LADPTYATAVDFGSDHHAWFTAVARILLLSANEQLGSPRDVLPGDGLAFKDPDMGMSCDAKLDRKDYPCTGPMLPQPFTVAMKDAA